MDLEDIYRRVMEESILYAEHLLKDAEVLLTKNALTNARALQNFAGDACAEALGCWLVSVGLLPSDHPDMQINERKSISISPHLKNKLGLLLRALSTLPEITPGEVIVALIIARASRDRRREWMQFTNPLEINADDVRDDLNLMLREFQFLKRFIMSTDEKTIEILKQDLKNIFTFHER